MCKGWCHDFKTDRLNCGRCGKRCNNGFGCINGVCGDEIKCPSGQIKCGHTCVVSAVAGKADARVRDVDDEFIYMECPGWFATAFLHAAAASG
jgi:hypothetical protein